jgi:hypothetical protein
MAQRIGTISRSPAALAAMVKHGNGKVTRGFMGVKVKPDAMAAFPCAAIAHFPKRTMPGLKAQN